jgi:cysteine synthase
VILCSAEGSFAEAARIRDTLAAEHGWFNPNQFSIPLKVECHERTTGPIGGSRR